MCWCRHLELRYHWSQDCSWLPQAKLPFCFDKYVVVFVLFLLFLFSVFNSCRYATWIPRASPQIWLPDNNWLLGIQSRPKRGSPNHLSLVNQAKTWNTWQTFCLFSFLPSYFHPFALCRALPISVPWGKMMLFLPFSMFHLFSLWGLLLSLCRHKKVCTVSRGREVSLCAF